MKRNKYIRIVFMSFALLSVVSGVSLFFAFLICALISVLLKTDSVWVFVLVGGPVAALFAVGWAVRHWAFVKAFLIGE